MANKVLNKMMGIFGLEDSYDELEEKDEEIDEDCEEDEEPKIGINGPKQSKVVNIHTNISTKVVIVKPSTFDEAAGICDDFKNRKIVVVNTVDLENRVAQRLLDFISGSSYVLGGNLQEVEKNVYVLAPSNVSITNELKTQLNSKTIFNINK